MKQEIITEFIYCLLTVALMLSLGLLALERTTEDSGQAVQTHGMSIL